MRKEVESGVRPAVPMRGTENVSTRKKRTAVCKSEPSNGNDYDASDNQATPTKRAARKQSTPAKGRGGSAKKDGSNAVLNGRITKNTTPTKGKNVVRGVKEEVESSGESMHEGMMMSFGNSQSGFENGYGDLGNLHGMGYGMGGSHGMSVGELEDYGLDGKGEDEEEVMDVI